MEFLIAALFFFGAGATMQKEKCKQTLADKAQQEKPFKRGKR